MMHTIIKSKVTLKKDRESVPVSSFGFYFKTIIRKQQEKETTAKNVHLNSN